jgi:nucleotide-binding universal stress UspA family protein
MAKKKLDVSGIGYRANILVGRVAESIVQHASKTRCDLIFIGSHGRTEAGNMLLGSTATKVLHIAKIPVLLVR